MMLPLMPFSQWHCFDPRAFRHGIHDEETNCCWLSNDRLSVQLPDGSLGSVASEGGSEVTLMRQEVRSRPDSGDLLN